MGTEQSSPRAAKVERAKKTCFYELLNVDQNASQNDIKKAYRSKALELHPDRNYGDVERTTALFSEVQTAYEVLSDPNERAWYDSHRDSILHGDAQGDDQYAGDIRLTSVGDITSLMSRFAASVSLLNNPDDLFSVVQDFFSQLAIEEALACAREDLDPVLYPNFGKATASYESNVKDFYAVWTGFSTRKTFAWKDAYNYAEAPDRRVRRLMEKENKHLRDEAIREFNDAVRVLVKFVKKRDPRCPLQQTDVDRLKALKGAAAAQAAKSRAVNEAKIKEQSVPSWDQPSRGFDDDDSDLFSNSETSEVEEVIECVICSKRFKSEKQFASHEKSKKHIKAAEQMRRQIRRDDRAISNREQGRNSGVPEADVQDVFHQVENVLEADEDMSANRSDYAQPSLAFRDSQPSPTNSSCMASMGISVEYTSSTPLQLGSPMLNRPEEAPTVTLKTTSSDLTEVTTSPKSPQAGPLILECQVEVLSDAETTTSSRPKDTVEQAVLPARKIGKAKAKRAKKAMRQDLVDQSSFSCVSCGSTFPSKTRLFRHIKDEGHARPMGMSEVS